MKKSLFALCTITLMSSCSTQSKLDNGTALKILQDNFHQFCKNDTKDYINSHYDGSGFNAYESYFNELNEQGLVKLEKNTYKHNGITSIKIRPTNKAKSEYEAGPGWSSFSVATTRLIPKEIVGISHQEDGNKAVVEFKADWEPTPFYNIQLSRNRCSLEKGTVLRANLIRFDTGWQIQ